MSQHSYAIVGAGVFGASTALHLIRKYPSAAIHLIDRQPFPCQVGASWDWNKVVRADYTDIFYMKLAIEAKHTWTNDPLFKQWYHPDGMYWISDSELANTVAGLYRELDAKEDFELLDPSHAKELYNGLFEDGDYNGVEQVLINRSSGWAEARNALGSVIQACVDLGVKYVACAATSLHFADDGSCIGVRTTDGNDISATKTILCTGAGTARLLADSAPQRDELQVGGRLVAAAVCTGLIKLNEEDAANLAGPVCCQDVLPGKGGSLPPNPQNEIKLWRDVPFKNTVKHSSGRLISSPPTQPDYAQWDVPAPLKAEVHDVSKAIFGKRAANFTIGDHRICWDAITPNEDFIICQHPHCENLHVATAGSFHGWKFLPILGKYVVQMLDGELDDELAKTWAWDRPDGPSPYGDMWPKRELRDIVGSIAETSLL